MQVEELALLEGDKYSKERNINSSTDEIISNAKPVTEVFNEAKPIRPNLSSAKDSSMKEPTGDDSNSDNFIGTLEKNVLVCDQNLLVQVDKIRDEQNFKMSAATQSKLSQINGSDSVDNLYEVTSVMDQTEYSDILIRKSESENCEEGFGFHITHFKSASAKGSSDVGNVILEKDATHKTASVIHKYKNSKYQRNETDPLASIQSYLAKSDSINDKAPSLSILTEGNCIDSTTAMNAENDLPVDNATKLCISDTITFQIRLVEQTATLYLLSATNLVEHFAFLKKTMLGKGLYVREFSLHVGSCIDNETVYIDWKLSANVTR